ncbi:MAG: hypothetical protein LUG91_01725 [Ruminococcus sp.]|nr:hypothetical protein [Ruminococcus sp.]
MDLYESRDSIEYRRALEKFYGNQLTLTGTQSIIKEWDEDDHPRGKDGKFVSSGGGSDSTTDSRGKAYSRPTLKLPKKEYGKVMSEINTLYYSRCEGKGRGQIYINNSVYSFEILGYNEYNIYDKGEI